MKIKKMKLCCYALASSWVCTDFVYISNACCRSKFQVDFLGIVLRLLDTIRTKFHSKMLMQVSFVVVTQLMLFLFITFDGRWQFIKDPRYSKIQVGNKSLKLVLLGARVCWLIIKVSERTKLLHCYTQNMYFIYCRRCHSMMGHMTYALIANSAWSANCTGLFCFCNYCVITLLILYNGFLHSLQFFPPRTVGQEPKNVPSCWSSWVPLHRCTFSVLPLAHRNGPSQQFRNDAMSFAGRRSCGGFDVWCLDWLGSCLSPEITNLPLKRLMPSHFWRILIFVIKWVKWTLTRFDNLKAQSLTIFSTIIGRQLPEGGPGGSRGCLDGCFWSSHVAWEECHELVEASIAVQATCIFGSLAERIRLDNKNPTWGFHEDSFANQRKTEGNMVFFACICELWTAKVLPSSMPGGCGEGHVDWRGYLGKRNSKATVGKCMLASGNVARGCKLSKEYFTGMLDPA